MTVTELEAKVEQLQIELNLLRHELLRLKGVNVIPGIVAALGDAAGSSIDVQLDVAGTPLLARITRKSAADLGLAPGRPVFALIKAVAIDRQSVGYA